MIKKALYSTLIITSLVAIGGFVYTGAEESSAEGLPHTQVGTSTESDTMSDEIIVENAGRERLPTCIL